MKIKVNDTPYNIEIVGDKVRVNNGVRIDSETAESR